MTPQARPPAEPAGGKLSSLEVSVLALFFFSGASALIYEVVWTRDLTNVFGGSAFAVATVLAAFMAGLALGSAVLGRVIDRRGHPLVVYAILEAGIALWALGLPVLLGLLDRLYAGIYRDMDPDFYTLSLIRFVLTFLVLLVPTTMMGGTLPVLGKLLLRNWSQLGQRAGLLYGVNTLGAVVGVAGGGFLLLPALGLRGATILAVAINLLVAAAAFLLARKFASTGTDAPASEGTPVSPVASRGLARAVLLVYAASGFAALAYEVAWTKTLSMILGTTTYAFSAMLTTFLLGLSLGSFLFSRLVDRYGRPEVLLALVQGGIPLLALATLPLMQYLPQLYVDGFSSLQGSWLGLELYKILLAAVAMILPTVLMGGTFPLVTRIYVGRTETGTQLGKLYAANTVGAILGSFLTGFVLIPWLGRQDSVLAASFVNIAAAVLLLAVIRWKSVSLSARWAVGALLVLLVPSTFFAMKPWDPRLMTSGAYVYAREMAESGSIKNYMKDHHLLYHDEATEAAVSVWHSQLSLSLRTNGKVEASSHGDMVTQKLISHLPVLYHQGEPEEALMIGLASGISVGALLIHPFQHVETVELMPSMADAARYFDAYNYRCLDDPRHRLILNDGRNHLLLTDKTYDIIVSEPSNPWIAGVGSLFTQEFFALTKKRLNPGGVICQWVQTYQFSEEDLKTILATFLDAYPHLHLWQGSPGDLILVASQDPLTLDIDRIRRAWPGRLGEDLTLLEIAPLAHTLGLFVTDRAGVEAYVGNWAGRVTDDNLYLEYAVPRHMARDTKPVTVTVFKDVTFPPQKYLRGVKDSGLEDAVMRYHRARWNALDLSYGGNPLTAEATMARLDRILEDAPNELLARSMRSLLVRARAQQALSTGDVSASVRGFQDIAAHGVRSDRAMALNNLGTIALSEGKTDSARFFWEAALDLEPNYFTVLNRLGFVASRDEAWGTAAEYLSRGYLLQPDDPQINNSLAYVLARGNVDLEKAEGYARHAVARDPNLHYRDTLGLVLLKLRKWTEAETVLSGVVGEDAAALESLLYLGMARAGSGKTALAREAFDSVIDRGDPSLAERARRERTKL